MILREKVDDDDDDWRVFKRKGRCWRYICFSWVGGTTEISSQLMIHYKKKQTNKQSIILSIQALHKVQMGNGHIEQAGIGR